VCDQAGKVTGSIPSTLNFTTLHGIIACLWVIGESTSSLKEAAERETDILTEVDAYDWITFLRMSDGSGAYNLYFGRLVTGKMKIREVLTRQGDAPEYVRRMQEEIFECPGGARSLEELRSTEAKARVSYKRYRDGMRKRRCGENGQ
jgi:DNA polymerase elongation subunit (family B)